MIEKNYYGYGFDHEIVENLRQQDWLLENSTEILKNKINVITRLPIPLNRQITNIVIKSFGWRNPLSKIFSPFTKSRAEKAYNASMKLIKKGISVPYPISVYTFRNKGKVQENFLITEDIPNNLMSREIFGSDEFSLETKKALVRKIADMVGKMHEHNIIHKDLTRGNFLVQNYHDLENMHVTLIDLNRISHRLFLTTQDRMVDIAKLNLCNCGLKRHRDCLWSEFLEHYPIGSVSHNRTVLKVAIRRNKLLKQMKKNRKNLKAKIKN